ncbi:MAG: hypothetical protein Q8T08_06535 [Ignavibacteria bacterium]|nr:hypothetical protein [Ignavibacteria bacterium]
MKTTKIKSETGKLIYYRHDIGQHIVVDTGPFALLQYKRNKIKSDPQYAKGKLIITY